MKNQLFIIVGVNGGSVIDIGYAEFAIFHGLKSIVIKLVHKLLINKI